MQYRWNTSRFSIGYKFWTNDDVSRIQKINSLDIIVIFSLFFRYCNSRIVRLDRNGRYVGQLGDDELNIPHSLALIEHLDLICVADRENKR